MIKFQGVFREFSVISGSAILGQIVSLLISFFIAQQLGAVKFGEYSYLLSLTTLSPILCGLGIPNAIYRFYNTSNSEEFRTKVVSSGFFIVLSSTLIISGVLFFTIEFIDLQSLQDYKLSITLLTFLLSLNNLFYVILRASRDYRVTAILSISQPIIKGTLILILFFFEIIKISSLLVVSNIIELLSFLTILFFIVKNISFRQFCINTVIKMFKYGSSFIPHKLLTKGQDPIIKSYVLSLIGPEAVGVYSLGQKITLPLGFIIDKFQFIWGPLKFNIKNENINSKEIFSNLINAFVIVISVTSSLYMLAVFGAVVCNLLPKYPGILSITLLFIILASLRGNYYMYGTGAEFGDNMRMLPLISGGYLVIIVLGGILFSNSNLKLSYIFFPIILAEMYAIFVIRVFSKRLFNIEISPWAQTITLILSASAILYIFTVNTWIFVMSGVFFVLSAFSNIASLKKAIQFLNKEAI